MGFTYAAMLGAEKELAQSLDHDQPFLKRVMEIVNEKWDKRLHRPLHVAGYYLNPYYYWFDPEINKREGVMDGLMECIDIFFPESDIQDKIVLEKEMPAYRQSLGAFGKPSAIRQRANPDLDPVEWWTNHGYGTPYLQRMALRILNLTCTSSGCERNWSTFEMLHTKKRNRLDVQRLNDLVYVQFNAKLKDKKEKIEAHGEPLESSYRDKAKDWLADLNPDEDEIYPGARLTWGEVVEASGVTERVYTRTRRNLQPTIPAQSTPFTPGDAQREKAKRVAYQEESDPEVEGRDDPLRDVADPEDDYFSSAEDMEEDGDY